ncbi:MAG TPA: LPS-assembly protein LptD [Pseudolabrys sp.]|nr:LPS-assembly protein LptD [Pseudolabrys sp.]
MAGPPSAPPPAARPRRGIARIAAVLAVAACCGLSVRAHAQTPTFLPVPPPPAKTQAAITRAGQKQMLMKADKINYDYANHLVSAVGDVQIYYKGSTLEADKVVYDQATKRLHAEGNVRLTEADGKVTYGQIIDLSDDYRNGFVDALRLNTPERTSMAAARAERTAGNFTVFHNGVYTACQPCKDNPKAPPEWQVKAKRIIHDQKEKMLYFEDARLEFWGIPLVWMPYFSAPDPTVKRKTGLLMPSVSSSSVYGVGFEVPYYFALAPNYDVTLAPKYTTKQGLLMQGEFRQRLLNGAYSIRAAGIRQEDPSAFNGSFGDRDWRGSLESSGRFAINQKWTWGWDALLLSDRYFLQDYNPSLSKYSTNPNNLSVTSEGISQAFIAGRGDRSYFDARSIYYLGFSGEDVQDQIPIVHPVIDYDYTVDHPVVGGELSFKTNFTSLSRQQPDFEAVTQAASNSGACNTADTAVKNSSNCILRGFPGNYNRLSAESRWRKTITDPLGQVWTPFASVRADAAALQVDNDPSVSNYLTPGSSELVRAMPTVGIDYRYPFVDVQSWGTQTIEPEVQVIARPNEPQIGKWPNEDAQSFVFDDSNLFRVNKFSGWDRVEGGGRTNYGLHYTAQFNKAGSVSALFGQSYQLFGTNSFAAADVTNTGLDSGLDTRLSDYVARLSYAPNSIYSFTSRFRFDKDSFDINRMELEAAVHFDRWSGSVLYGDYAAQPDIGFLSRRQGILTSGSVKLATNWVLSGGALYDLEAGDFAQTSVGLGYVDDCLILALNYITSYSYSSGSATPNHIIGLTLSLRTLGQTTVNQSVTPTTSSGSGSVF